MHVQCKRSVYSFVLVHLCLCPKYFFMGCLYVFSFKRRGFIMGLWNSHTSVGSIVGTIVPAAFEDFGW